MSEQSERYTDSFDTMPALGYPTEDTLPRPRRNVLHSHNAAKPPGRGYSGQLDANEPHHGVFASIW